MQHFTNATHLVYFTIFNDLSLLVDKNNEHVNDVGITTGTAVLRASPFPN